jgi:hypothetical protein
VQVADDAPGPRQALSGIEHGLHEVIPRGRCLRSDQAIDQAAVLVDELPDGRRNVLRHHGVKAGQAGKIEQWVHVGPGSRENRIVRGEAGKCKGQIPARIGYSTRSR